MGDWTRVCCLEAADVNVRTLCKTLCSVPYPWRVSVVDEIFWSCEVLWLFRDIVVKWMARKLSGGQNHISESCTLQCLPSRVSTDPVTGVSIDQGGRGGW
jgi:hypothetical protein